MGKVIHTSAGVYPFEDDRSLRPADGIQKTTSVAFVIYADQGRVDQIISCKTVNEITGEFGFPNPNIGNGGHYGLYCAIEALKECKEVLITRVHADALFGGTILSTDATSALVLNPFTTGKHVDPFDANKFALLAADTDFTATTKDLFYIYGASPTKNSELVRIVISDVKDTTDKTSPNTFKISVFMDDKVGVNDNPLETWTVSRDRQTDGFGRQQYMEDVINGNSKFIRVRNNPAAVSATPGATLTSMLPAGTTLLDTDAAGSPAYLVKGDSGNTFPTIDTDDHIVGLDKFPTGVGTGLFAKKSGWQLYMDKEMVKVDVLCNAGYCYPEVQKAMITLAEHRADCFAILDIPADKQGNKFDPTAQAISYRKTPIGINGLDSSYGGLYTPWYVVEDTFNNQILQIPSSGHIAAIFARTDRIAATWFSPAGMKRGYLNILDVGCIYNQESRDALVAEQINPTRIVPGVGMAVWGDETMQIRPTALSSINVRRLLIHIGSNTENILLTSVFDPNDDFLRTEIKHALIALLEPIKNGRGLYAYTVVCDESNNLPSDVDNGILNVDIYLQPVIPAKRIYVQLIITRTGVSIKVG